MSFRALVFILSIGLGLLQQPRPVCAEPWQRLFSADGLSLHIDEGSILNVGRGAVEYRIKQSQEGVTESFVYVKLLSPDGRYRFVAVEKYDSGQAVNRSTPENDPSFNWDWQTVKMDTLEALELDFVRKHLNKSGSVGRWRVYVTSEDGTQCYVDTLSITWPSESECRVWCKQVPPDKRPEEVRPVITTFWSDRTYRVESLARKPIPPESIIEVLWYRVFYRGKEP